MLRKIKSSILLILKPIQKIMQRFGAKEKIITSAQVNMIASMAKPGDILLSYEAQRFTSMFIPGKWDHAAIVTDLLDVMEAVGDDYEKRGDKLVNLGGVRKMPLTEWLFKKDHVCLIRPLFEDPTINIKAGANAYKYEHQSYDYAFSIDNESVYCSELVYLCYQPLDPEFMGHITREIYPTDYLKECFLPEAKFILLYSTRD